MLNTYEFGEIRITNLPTKWQEPGALDSLNIFLQENWNQRKVFYEDNEIKSKQQFLELDKKRVIKARNYIGTISFEGEQLNIFPKVFKLDESDKYDCDTWNINDLVNNLVIWLSYCDKLNFPFVDMKAELNDITNLLEFFITIYIRYVKNALNKYPYYCYENVKEDTSQIKGKINISDYYSKKFPNGLQTTFNCEYSKFEFDNLLNQIIKSTCRLLLKLSQNEINKDIIRKILIKLGDVSDKNCSPNDCDKIHLSKLHSQYSSIISMSKMFLLNKESNYDMGNSSSYCFLFPTELLFEGFIAGFLKEELSSIAKVSSQTSNQHLATLKVDGEIIGDRFDLREDILIEKDNNIFVLDTKYKEIEPLSSIKEDGTLDVSDQDMKQMAVYAFKRQAKRLALIYPLYREEEVEDIKVQYDIEVKINDETKKFPVFILKVPFIFSNDIETQKQIIKDTILKIL